MQFIGTYDLLAPTPRYECDEVIRSASDRYEIVKVGKFWMKFGVDAYLIQNTKKFTIYLIYTPHAFADRVDPDQEIPIGAA